MRAPRVRPLLLGAGALVVAGAVVLVVALATGDDDGTARPPAGSTLAAALARATPAGEPFAALTEARVALGERCLRVAVADEADERQQGLRGRAGAAPYDAMLFVFPDERVVPFTMAGVPADLSIAWFDRDGRRVGGERMTACPDGTDADCPQYRARAPHRYALESAAGGAAAGAGALGACP